MGEALLPKEETVLQEGDILHMIAGDNDMDRINKVLSAAPEEESN